MDTLQAGDGLNPLQQLLAELFSTCERIEITAGFVRAAAGDGVPGMGPDAAWEVLADALETLESASEQLTETTDEVAQTVRRMSVARTNMSHQISIKPLADVSFLWADSPEADAQRPGRALTSSADAKARPVQLYLVPDPDAPVALDGLRAAIADVHDTSHSGGAVHICTEPLCREFTEFTAHERTQD
jgi:hypothetical protein